jgi:hypothetical protein
MTMTIDASDIDVRRLPVVVDLPTAARLLGIGRTSAYELVRTGQWPTPVIRGGAPDPRPDRAAARRPRARRATVETGPPVAPEHRRTGRSVPPRAAESTAT